MNDSTVLDVNNLQVSYGDIQALWDITFKVKQNEILAVLGPNGAGKTTSFKSIIGLLSQKSGTVQLNNTDITNLHPSKIVELGIAYVPEGRRLFPFMTVKDNLMMGSYVKRARSKRDELFNWVHELFPILKEREIQQARTLSGGEQQMLAIGRALMSDPSVLILDEPSLGLAPIIVQDLFSVVKEVNSRGVTVIISEQHLQMVLQIADRGYVLEDGRVVLEGKSSDLLENEHVKTAYLGI